MTTATAIYITADVDVDYDGDEILIYHVGVGNDDGDYTGKVYTTTSRDKAFDLGERMARDRGLELVAD